MEETEAEAGGGSSSSFKLAVFGQPSATAENDPVHSYSLRCPPTGTGQRCGNSDCSNTLWYI